jgi:protein arginine N-methyltransferase 1
MLNEREIESCYLGQFIPVHYHHNMLMDQNRMHGFKSAIDYAVKPGAKVLELGGGTGVLSWFAAAKAAKVYCVEFNPDMVKEARKMLALNPNGDKVEVVHADAFEYLPPEPVDVVICEMIHVGMLREKQVEVIESFKRRYLERFGGPLPVFLPEAVIMAVQPLQQEYDFEGFYAPIVQFQETTVIYPGHGGNGAAGRLQHHRLQPAERPVVFVAGQVRGRAHRRNQRCASSPRTSWPWWPSARPPSTGSIIT